MSSESKEKNEIKKKSVSRVKVITLSLLVFSVIYFTWYVLADRLTPYTEQARINGLVNPISPRVSGYLTKINVKLHSKVNVGDTLFQLDQRPFILAVKSAEAHLDNTAQMVSARTASVKAAAGRLGVARAQLDRAQRNYDRVQRILQQNPGALSLADKDQAETALSQATEQVASAEADLEKSQQALGVSGPENPQFRAALLALEQAQLNLAFSTIIAEAPGFIESMYVDLGFYAQNGQPIATLVSQNDVWIRAELKENNISNLRLGEMVEFALDVEPGKIYKGSIRSIGYGISAGEDTRGSLPSISGQSGWLRDPQRFPVIIEFNLEEIDINKIRIGGQADVVAYSGDNGLLNAISRFRIRFNSWLSYLR
jgi:multidrug resistance efflux pump